MKGRDLISINDLSKEEIYTFIEAAKQFKVASKLGKKTEKILEGKILAMVYEFESTRTRVGFEAAMAQLGGHAIYLPAHTLMIAKGEPWKDTARVLSRIADGIVVRAHEHETLYEIAKYADVPVISASTNKGHPDQTLGEFLTILEKKGRLEGLKLVYCGMTRGMCHDLLVGCPKVGMDVAIVYPEIYDIDKKILEQAYENAKETGAKVTLTHNLQEAIKDADIVYSCVLLRGKFAPEEVQKEESKIDIKAYQVNAEILKKAKDDAIVMHPGPAYRDIEITEDVLEGPRSVFFDQVENAYHMKKAILSLILG